MKSTLSSATRVSLPSPAAPSDHTVRQAPTSPIPLASSILTAGLQHLPTMQGEAPLGQASAPYNDYLQQLAYQQVRQPVLVLLPSTVNIVNLNLMQVVAEAQKTMHRPISFSDLVITVAATPLITTTEGQIKTPAMVDSSTQTEPVHSGGQGWDEPGVIDKSGVDSLAETIGGTGLSDVQRDSEPATAPTIKPKQTHPFPANMVTSYRPAGDGPAPFHVTVRALRPSVTSDSLLALARDTKSLAKLFFPPFAPSFFVGRAATYFFHDKNEGLQFCTRLRNRAEELQDELGLTEKDFEAAKLRGVKGIGLHGKPKRLTVTMSDQKKREKLMARLAAAKQTSSIRKQGGSADGQAVKEPNECTDDESSESESRAESDSSESGSESDGADNGMDQHAKSSPHEHFLRMTAPESESNPPIVYRPSIISRVDHRGLGLTLPHVLLHNVRASVLDSDVLQLVRRCLSLKQIYLPQVASIDSLGRTAAFCFTDENEAKGFAQYLQLRPDRGTLAQQFEMDHKEVEAAAIKLSGMSLAQARKAAKLTVGVVCPERRRY